MYTILNYPLTPLHISKLSGGDSDTTFIGGIDKQYPLFSFNKNTASQWKAVNLWGLYNSFIVPQNNEITVGLVKNLCKFLRKKICLTHLNYVIADYSNIDSHTFHGIAYSKGYGDPHADVSSTSEDLKIVEPDNVLKIMFTCKALNFTSENKVTIAGTE